MLDARKPPTILSFPWSLILAVAVFLLLSLMYQSCLGHLSCVTILWLGGTESHHGLLDLWVHVLMRVTGRVDCFGCVCALQTLRSSTLCFMCTYVHVLCCYFTGIFYALVRQISMLFTDNKDSVFGSIGDRLLLRLLMYNCTLCSLCFNWRSM